MFNKNTTWKEIVSSYLNNPRDVIAKRLSGAGNWFYVYAEKDNVYIDCAKHHLNSSKIKVRRILDKKNLDAMLTLYYKRKNGEKVSQEAGAISQNQTYWYGIFADLNI